MSLVEETVFAQKEISVDGHGPAEDVFVPLLTTIARDHIEAVILYGSRLLGANPGRHSAYDLVLIVDEYKDFYEALYSANMIHRLPMVMAIMSYVLPPNVIRLAPEGVDGPIAKCLVLNRPDFERSLAIDQAKDHFMISRMMQKVKVIYSKSEAVGQWVQHNLGIASYGVLTWATLWIDQPFDAASLAREMLRICYRSENRPESDGRSDTIFLSQEKELVEYYANVLTEAEVKGDMVRDGNGYRTMSPVSMRSRLGRIVYFKVSKLSVTLSWLKHVVTFEGWLPYIVRKVERRTGSEINLTLIEKVLPIPCLVPRVLYVFWNRPKTETEANQDFRMGPDQREN